MNEAQRSVIQRHYRQLADDLIMTEELLGSLFQKKVFERAMIEMIKAEKTSTEQTYKMLSILPKRGPEAFDAFIEIIKADYPWLATMLETSHRTATELLSRQNSFVCTCGGIKINTEQLPETNTPRPSVTEVVTDPDIKTRVGTFIHKQFGQSKRISQIDKKSMEKWFAEQLQYERKRLKLKKTPSIEEGTEVLDQRVSCTSPPPNLVQVDIKRVYNKVRDENLSDSLNGLGENNGEKNEEGSDEVDGLLIGSIEKPEDLTPVIVKLEGEIDILINRVNQMEGLVTQCHYILGDPDKKQKLPTLVKDAQIVSRQFERELIKEKAKSEKMLTELYDYCKSINKLESNRQQQRLQMEKHLEEIEELKGQNTILREKCKILEAANIQHMEKEQTLENLRKMVTDLKNNHNSLMDENANNRTQGSKGFRRPLRSQNRRGSIVESNVLGISNNFIRKGTTKASINSTRRKPPTRF